MEKAIDNLETHNGKRKTEAENAERKAKNGQRTMESRERKAATVSHS